MLSLTHSPRPSRSFFSESETAHDTLNASITEAKVLQVIKSLRPSSAPGLDGFSGLYYKKFAGLLETPLTNFFNVVKR